MSLPTKPQQEATDGTMSWKGPEGRFSLAASNRAIVDYLEASESG